VSYRLVIQQSAAKALQQIDEPGAFRIRVGGHRVLYEINDSELIVLVLKSAHRSTVYKR
jgi:mRNA-degrading endonuclease RelE of RelBE toxin-antitoxin system